MYEKNDSRSGQVAEGEGVGGLEQGTYLSWRNGLLRLRYSYMRYTLLEIVAISPILLMASQTHILFLTPLMYSYLL